jgi:hypothetical protein
MTRARYERGDRIQPVRRTLQGSEISVRRHGSGKYLYSDVAILRRGLPTSPEQVERVTELGRHYYELCRLKGRRTTEIEPAVGPGYWRVTTPRELEDEVVEALIEVESMVEAEP